MVAGWNIPVSAAYCALQNQAITCPAGDGVFTPLSPSFEVVSSTWWSAFLTTAWTASVVSVALLWCERKLNRHGSHHSHHHPTVRMIKVLERLINSLSDQQSLAGLSLVIVAGHNGCEISAYVYNLVCFQLVMTLITHLNALTNTQNWFGAEGDAYWRSILNGIVKLVPIAVTIVLSGVMLGARLGGHFPTDAGAAATFAAACFENQDKLQAINAFKSKGSASNGFAQYMILVCDLMVVGAILLLALLKKVRARPQGYRAKLSWYLRTISTLATLLTLCWLSAQYILMRRHMEDNPAWYQPQTLSNQYSYFNVVTWALFASTIYSIMRALSEAYNGNEKKALAALQISDHVEKMADHAAGASNGVWHG